MSSTVFISGATAGVGGAAAYRCAVYGARLVLCRRRANRLEALKKDLDVPVQAFILDMRDRSRG